MVLSFCFLLFFLFGCTTLERDNVYDQKGNKGVSSSNFTDKRDNKTYRTVQIGSQTWMAENLNYKASGSVCYDNESFNCDTYGRLYDWETAMTACPSGWHLPSYAEWTTLTDYADNSAGTKLKARSGWNDSGNGSDDYGFSALPGGGYSDGGFNDVGIVGRWWSSAEYDATDAYRLRMNYSSSNVSRGTSDKSNLYSVRCLRD